MVNEKKKRIGIVYSTNKEYEFQIENENKVQETLPVQQQNLIISLDKRNRKGKVVTLVSGFIGKEEDLNNLSKMLKTKCGVGGTAKDGDILIQGDFRDKIVQILQNEGYKVKKSGGN